MTSEDHVGDSATTPRDARSTPGRSAGADPDPLFAYGTLTFPEVLRVVFGRLPACTEAVAAGWRAAPVRGRVFPTLVPDSASLAPGLLITDLTAAEWRTVDAYEAPTYDLVRLELDRERHGWSYVHPRHPDRSVAWTPLPEQWSRSEFRRAHLSRYLEQCEVWRAQLSLPRAAPVPAPAAVQRGGRTVDR
jgi:hypothetical protein